MKKTSDAPPSDSGDSFIKTMRPVAETIEKKTKQLNAERTKMKDAFNAFVSSYGEVTLFINSVTYVSSKDVIMT